MIHQQQHAPEIEAIEERVLGEAVDIIANYIPNGTTLGGPAELIDVMSYVPDAVQNIN